MSEGGGAGGALPNFENVVPSKLMKYSQHMKYSNITVTIGQLIIYFPNFSLQK